MAQILWAVIIVQCTITQDIFSCFKDLKCHTEQVLFFLHSTFPCQILHVKSTCYQQDFMPCCMGEKLGIFCFFYLYLLVLDWLLLLIVV